MTMQINRINTNYGNYFLSAQNQNRRPSFQRQLTPEEAVDYKQNAIEPALKYLGVENLAMVLHGSCNPVSKLDMGVGSPNGKEAENMIEFETLHGFNANQLGPMGEVTRGDISPYSASIFAINRLFIDLDLLATDEYANILPKSKAEALKVDYSPDGKVYTYSRFFDSFENTDRLIKDSYQTFKEKIQEKDPNALKLLDEYKDFKAKKGEKIMQSALFEVLSRTYGTRDIDVWESDVDRNLIQLLKEGDVNALSRYRQLRNRSSEDINAYMFAQFIENKQLKENKKFRDKIGFEYINDNLIGNDKSEEWMYNGIFLKNYRIGCPSGGENNGPQLWDIPVLNPKLLFNEDNSLGPAGKFLKDKIESELEFCENIRIDHALGLVDPYVYDKTSVSVNNGKYDFSRFKGGNISQMSELDPHGNYKKVLEFIVLPILKEHNIPVDKAVWEDLGDQTDAFKQIYINQLHIPGMTQLHWTRGEGSSRDNWLLMGSHDEPAAISYIKEDYARNSFDTYGSAWNVDYLSGFLNSDPARAREKEQMKQNMLFDPMERVKAKFAELLLTGKRVQIPFTDFFGIYERYNLKGQKLAKNWKLRLSSDFKDLYYKNLSSEHPTAINMPEILKMSVQAKIDREVVNYINNYATFSDGSKDNKKIEQYREDMENAKAPLIEKLAHYEKILKEPE